MAVDFVRYRYRDGVSQSGGATRGGFGVRYIQALYTFAALGILCATRVSVVVTSLIIARQHGWCHLWLAFVFASYYVGYCPLSPLAVLCRKRTNAKYALFIVLLFNGLISFVIPASFDRHGWLGVCGAHALLGAVHAWTLANVETLTKHWIPPQESNTLGATVYGGIAVGTAVSFPLCGQMSSSPLGWRFICYMWGLVSLSMSAIWVTLTSATPRRHPAIGDSEREYIEESVRERITATVEVDNGCQLMRSHGFVSLAAAHCAVHWLYVQLIFALPIYLIAYMDVQQLCWCLFAPILTMCITSALMVNISDSLYHNTILTYMMSISTYRKILNIAGGAFACGAWILVFVVAPAMAIVVVVMVAVGAAIAVKMCGYMEIVRDAMANSGATIMHLCGNISAVGCCVVPIMDALILDTDVSVEYKWRLICLSSVCVCILLDVIHAAYASSEAHAWRTHEFRPVDTDENGYGMNEIAENNLTKRNQNK